LAARAAGADQALSTFALDLFGADGRFVATPFQETSDVPFAKDVARHIGSAHVEVTLTPKTVADPSVRRATVNAGDSPGAGEMDQSLFLLCKSLRERAVVALCGESGNDHRRDAVEMLADHLWRRGSRTVLARDEQHGFS
jgi:asparagine synthase (glutamine-hydrolysing)